MSAVCGMLVEGCDLISPEFSLIVVDGYSPCGDMAVCLQSLQAQAGPDFEIILASTNGAGQSASKFDDSDARIKVLGGIADDIGTAWNRGLDAARGEYILFLDTSVVLEKDALAQLHNFLLRQRTDVVLFGAKQFALRDEEAHPAPFLLHPSTVEDKKAFSGRDIPNDIFFVAGLTSWNKAFRRELLEKESLGFPAGLSNSSEFSFVCTALAVATSISVLDEPLVTQRVWTVGEYQEAVGDPRDFVDASRRLIDGLRARNLYERYERAAVRAILYLCASRLHAASTQERYEAIVDGLLSDEFSELGVFSRPDDFYLGKQNKAFVQGALYARAWVARRDASLGKADVFSVVCAATESRRRPPKISVIIPMYQVEDYIGACLDSVISQSFEDFEVICIDDGSDDDTGDIALEYARRDDRIILIRQDNMGVAVARNHGVEFARGEYAVFLDADDMLPPNSLGAAYAVAKDLDLDCLLFDGECVIDDSTTSMGANLGRYQRRGSYPSVTTGIDMFRQMRSRGEFFLAPVLYISKSAHLRKHALRFHRGTIHEDNAFTTLNVASAKRCGYIHESLYRRRIRTNSIMTRSESFDNVYGYYCAYRDLDARLRDFKGLTLDERNALYDMAIRLLRTSRETLARIPEEQRYVYRAFDPEERYIFERDVVLPAQWKADLTDRHNKMKEARKRATEGRDETKRLCRRIDDLNVRIDQLVEENERLRSNSIEIGRLKIWLRIEGKDDVKS